MRLTLLVPDRIVFQETRMYPRSTYHMQPNTGSQSTAHGLSRQTRAPWFSCSLPSLSWACPMTATSTTSRWDLKILFLIPDSLFQLFDGETDIEGQIITFCGSIAESRQTTTNTLYVRWVQPSQNQFSTQNFPEVFNTIINVKLILCAFFKCSFFPQIFCWGEGHWLWVCSLVLGAHPTGNQTKPNQTKPNPT